MNLYGGWGSVESFVLAPHGGTKNQENRRPHFWTDPHVLTEIKEKASSQGNKQVLTSTKFTFSELMWSL